MTQLDTDIHYWAHMLDESFSTNEPNGHNEFNEMFKTENIYGMNVIDCSGKNLQQIPEGCQQQIGVDSCKVSFDCSNNQLKNLIGSPEIVYGNFDCSNNPLTSLEGCPREVHGDLILSECQNLTSLVGAPEIVDGIIFANECQLKTLEGCPKECESLIVFRNKLTSLKYSPEIVKDTFNCSVNPLVSLEGCTQEVGSFICNNCCLKTLIGSPAIVRSNFDVSENDLLKSLNGAPSKVGKINTLGTSILGIKVDNYMQSVRRFAKMLANAFEKGIDTRRFNSLEMIDGHYSPMHDIVQTTMDDHLSRSRALRNAAYEHNGLEDPFKSKQQQQFVKDFLEYRKKHQEKASS